jgi:hypothetical protein
MPTNEKVAKALLDDLDLYRDQWSTGSISQDDYDSEEECIWALIRAADGERPRRRIQQRHRHGSIG